MIDLLGPIFTNIMNLLFKFFFLCFFLILYYFYGLSWYLSLSIRQELSTSSINGFPTYFLT